MMKSHQGAFESFDVEAWGLQEWKDEIRSVGLFKVRPPVDPGRLPKPGFRQHQI